MKILSLLLVIILITSCASLNFPPPTPKIDQIKLHLGELDQEVGSQSKQSLWATLYLNGKFFEAKKDYKQACTLFSTLNKMKEFPLLPLVNIKQARNCRLTSEKASLFLGKELKSIPLWAREQFVKDGLEIARKFKNKTMMAKFYALSAKYKKFQEDKLPLIRKAIKLAPKGEQDKYLQELYKIAPHTYPKPNNDNVYTIAKDFERNRKFRKARVLYRKIIKSKDFTFKERVDAYERVRMTYKLQRDTKNYVKHTRKMDKFIRRYLHNDFTNPDYVKRWIESQTTLARLYWTENVTKKALKILHDLLQKEIAYPNLKANIYNILSGIAMEDKKTELALKYLKLAKEVAINDKELKDKINWLYGWNLYLSQNYQASAEAFEDAAKESEGYYFKLKCSFWEAKSYLLSGDQNSGNELLEELAELDSFGYYGIMAHRELKKPFRSLYHQNQSPKRVTPTIATYEWLISMDEKDLAQDYLRSYSYKFKTKNEIESSLPLYLKTDDHFWAIHRFYRIEAPEREDVLTRNAYLIFPRPYSTQIEKIAKRFKLTPEYLYSITRQESAFDSEARSPAEAYGLMQLIPKRAQELSRKYNIRYRRPRDLYKPNTNIFMGGALLNRLKKDLQGEFVLSTASYNAKISAVRRWYKKRFDGDYAKFVEMIPYSETQGYIKLVLRNFITYKRLRDRERFLFPEEIFKGHY